MTDALEQRIERLFDEERINYYKGLMPAILAEESIAAHDRTRTVGQRNAVFLCEEVAEMVSIIEALQQRVKEREKTIGDAYMNITCGKTSEAECTLRGDIISRIPQYMAENKE